MTPTRKRHGGFRRGSGARVGNRNAVKALSWSEDFDLSSREGIDRFIQEVIRATWTGQLGSRQAGAINNSVKVLIEHEVLPELERRIKLLESREVK